MGWDRHKLLWDGMGQKNMSHGQACARALEIRLVKTNNSFSFYFEAINCLRCALI